MRKLIEKIGKFDFDGTCLIIFGEFKKKLVFAPIIIASNWGEPFEVVCDANGVALGVVLGKSNEMIHHPIYYASKAVNRSQNNYTVIEKDILYMVFAFEKFCS